MKITYDAEADAMYIYLQGKPGQAVDRTEVLGGGIAVDYGPEGAVFGIEILDASERLGFQRGCPEVSLEQMVFKGSSSRQLDNCRASPMKWIVADPEHLGGKPRVAGTRISIEFLLETLASGMTIPEMVQAYPSLTEDAIKGALEELAHSERIGDA